MAKYADEVIKWRRSGGEGVTARSPAPNYLTRLR